MEHAVRCVPMRQLRNEPFPFRVFVGWAPFVDIADLAGVTLSVADSDLFEHGFCSPLRCYAQTSLTLGTVSETPSRGRRAVGRTSYGHTTLFVRQPKSKRNAASEWRILHID